MIDNQYGKYTCVCDTCETSPNITLDSWDDAISYMKDNDWKVYKYNGDWCHICPDCSDAE